MFKIHSKVFLKNNNMEQQRTWAEYKAPYVLRKNQAGDPVMEEWVRVQNELLKAFKESNPNKNGKQLQ